MQALPPTLNIGVNADSGYDADGISLIADPDDSQFQNNSDDEEQEDSGQAPLFLPLYVIFIPTMQFCILLCIRSASRAVRFAEEPEIRVFDDSAQDPYAPPPNTPTALPSPYPEPMHPSAPSFSITLDTQLLQLTVCLS